MYEFTKGMREISGFGGSYEAGCRAMVKSGMEFLDANPGCNPVYKGSKGIYGLILEDNDDAKALTNAVMNAPFINPDTGKQTTVREYGATGAMHQAAISHCLFIRKKGWSKYVEEMSKLD